VLTLGEIVRPTASPRAPKRASQCCL
jgi:hypothetical protein